MVREFVNFPGADDEFHAFLDEFQTETDRAAAVLGAAYAEELLRSLLTRRFVDDGEYVKELTQRGGPISSFSARISLGYAIGLTSGDASDLHRLRGIRNDFAHKLHGITFATQSVADRCREFKCVRRIFAAKPDVQARYPNEPRKLFDLAVAYCAGNFSVRSDGHGG
jgi:mannitol operon repressor